MTGDLMDGFKVAEDPRPAPDLGVMDWRAFRDHFVGDVPCLVDGIWQTGGMGFIASAPKRGKTWLALLLSLAVASGRPFVGRFQVPEPRPVLYVALEGSGRGMRARIGALSRGMGLNPDAGDLDRLVLAYRPRGIDLLDEAWTSALIDQAEGMDAGLVVVDVLRRAAAIRESGEGSVDFGRLVGMLQPLADEGRAVCFCHHFRKAPEGDDKRLTAEMMAGSGALYGHMDNGLFISKSEDGAKLLHVECESRELSPPKPFAVRITGEGSGHNGAFTFKDRAAAVIDSEASRPEVDRLVDDLRALFQVDPAVSMRKAAAQLGTTRDKASFRRAWEMAKQGGGGVGGGYYIAHPTTDPGVAP